MHSGVYEEFVKHFVETTKAYKLGDPTKTETNLGPVVSLASAERIRKQVKDAGELFDNTNEVGSCQSRRVRNCWSANRSSRRPRRARLSWARRSWSTLITVSVATAVPASASSHACHNADDSDGSHDGGDFRTGRGNHEGGERR